MRIQNLFFTLFVLCLPFSAFCQQPVRQQPLEQHLEQRLAALRNLEDMAFRFGVAWQERDCPSLQEIRQELLRMMRLETEACALLPVRPGLEQELAAALEGQRLLALELQDYKLPASAAEFPEGTGTAPLAQVTAFRELTQETIGKLFQR